MKTFEAMRHIREFDKRGHTVWSTSGLRAVLQENPPAFRKTVERLCAEQVLVRVARGLYVYALTERDRRAVFGEVIANLRKGEYCFESLESAASEWGIISQTPLGALTVMTTGRSGRFETPYGPVEFVHTNAAVGEILDNTVPRDGFIPLATREYAIHGLRRCGRTAELGEAVALGELKEVS